MSLRHVVQVIEADFLITAAKGEGLLLTELDEHRGAARQQLMPPFVIATTMIGRYYGEATGLLGDIAIREGIF